MKASYWCTWTTFLYVFTESDTAVIASIFVVGIVAALASCAGICFCCICTCQRVKQIGSRWENRFGYILCMTLCNTTTGIFAGAPSTHLASRYHRTSALNSQLFLNMYECSEHTNVICSVENWWKHRQDFERKRVTKRVYIWCAVQLCAGGWS